MKQHFIEDSLLLFSKPTFDIILKQQDAGELLALYCFYYYTAKWQGTNIAKSTTCYTAQGLGWSVEKVAKYKRQLSNLKLIEEYQDRDPDTQKIKGYYILVKYVLWTPGACPPESLPQGFSSPNALKTSIETDHKMFFQNIIWHPLKMDAKTDENKEITPPIKFTRTTLPLNSIRTRLRCNLPPPPVTLTSPDRLVEYWNTLPNVRHHTAPGTYKAAQQSINLLRNGALVHSLIDSKWLLDRGIPNEWLSHRWTDLEIREGLRCLSLMCTPGYWPVDKKWLKNRNLPDLIYNTYSNKSMLLQVLHTPPVQVTQHIAGLSKYADLAEQFCTAFHLNEASKVVVVKHIDKLVIIHSAIPSKAMQYGDFVGFCPTPRRFIQNYINWLQGEGWINRPSASLLNPKGAIFAQYFKRWDESSNSAGVPLSQLIKI